MNQDDRGFNGGMSGAERAAGTLQDGSPTSEPRRPGRGPSLGERGTGTVYVVQRQLRYDRGEGRMVDMFDLSPAMVYGTLGYVLSPEARPTDERIVETLRHELRHYEGRCDYLLLIGNPCLIAMTCSVAARISPNGEVSLLQWDRRRAEYTCIHTKF